MSSKKVVKKVDLTKVKVQPWMKPDKLVWIEIMDDTGTIVKKYTAAIIDSVDDKEKLVKLKYDGLDKGPDDCYANSVLERADHPQDLEDLVNFPFFSFLFKNLIFSILTHLGGYRPIKRR